MVIMINEVTMMVVDGSADDGFDGLIKVSGSSKESLPAIMEENKVRRHWRLLLMVQLYLQNN